MDFNGRSVLITGGTGSFGRRFAERLLTDFEPRRVAIFSRDELKQSEMAQLHPFDNHKAMRFFIGDVRDRLRLEQAMRGMDFVVHAAALKQVPAAEYNPFECIRTNVMGSENVVQAAMRAGVKRVVALSTDKAVTPVNLYGASKLAAEKIFVAANNMSGKDGSRFSVVRYGNVIGSRGSVIPLFQRLIREGADSLPVTDERMTRFWITLDQGVDLVIGALDTMEGGEVFIPKIPSMRIVDLAEAMAPGMATRIVGIRPGEKLHETLVAEDDARHTVETDDSYIIEPAFTFWERERAKRDDARPVGEGFSYTSNRNPQILSPDDLRGMLETMA